jgi:PAS domain S-box-containing protein
MSSITIEGALGAPQKGDHFVRFYDDEIPLLAEVADFIDDALCAGGVGIIIATADHVQDLRRRLAGLGNASNHHTWFPGKLITLDAEDALAQFMVGDWPDENRFNQVVGEVVRSAFTEGKVVHAFGEMVALLCERGLPLAAIRLEELWNALATTASFSLFCAYPWRFFPTAESASTFRQVCGAHDHVCALSHTALSGESKDVHLSLAELEQRTRALTAEVARRAAVEQTLKQREKEFADFVDNAAEGIHRVAADGTILWANKAELAMLGYGWEEYVGHHIADFHVDYPIIESILQKLSRGETLYDQPARLRCKDGAIKHVLLNSNGSFEDGHLRYTRCFTRDATERHERDEALVQRNQVLLHAPVATALLHGPDFNFQLANRRFHEMVARVDVVGKPFMQVFPELECSQVTRLIYQVFATGKPVSDDELHFVIHDADGSRKERFIKLSLEPLAGINGKTDSIILVAVDITEQVTSRKALEKAGLERTELLTQLASANSSKDEFLAMLGHELRNPLSPIVMALELMQIRGDATTKPEQDIIRRQVHHMVRLVDDLLDISRITRGRIALQVGDLELSGVLVKAIEMASPLIEHRGHHFNVDIEPGLHMAGDPVRLAQVVTNLLTNAARYTENGGHITLSAARETEDVVRIIVKDDGIGIPDELLPRIFDLFLQGKQSLDRAAGGLGIGLSLVKNITELHGGTVKAESRGVGFGSEFILRLPIKSPSEKPAASDNMQSNALVPSKRRVMLVDDNVDAVNTLEKLLTHCGHVVEVFNDPVAALSATPRFKPQIAVLDIGLPVLNGYDLALEMRSIMGDHPCRMIALTGYGQDVDRAKSQAAGFERHLVKPINPDQIISVVNLSSGPAIDL